MMLRLTRIILLVLAGTSSAALPWGVNAAESDEGKTANFVRAADLDLTTLLPPPPADDSAQTKAELAEIHHLRETVDPARERQAVADQTETVFAVVAGDLGPAFTAERLPVTKAFFERVLNDESVIVHPAKAAWKRPRPPMLDPSIKPCGKSKSPTSGAYPSGHATVATLSAVVLGEMLPEKRRTIFNDAARFSESRVICGVHYRSDIEASKIVGTLIAAQIRSNPAFQTEFAAARSEVRKALGFGN